MTYPEVISERATLELVQHGRSLARYGDGEFNLCRGASIRCQPHHPELQRRLIAILQDSGDCLVGIPNLRSETPKAAFWGKYGALANLLTDRPYASAFVSRPDSAPWIDTEAYWTSLASLWVGQEVTLVRGSARSLTAEDLHGACVVREIVAPATDAWQAYASLLENVTDAWSAYASLLKDIGRRPERVILCLGPTATVMAVDLCARGVQAIDLGHVGMFWKKHLRGEPMVVTDADKVAAA